MTKDDLLARLLVMETEHSARINELETLGLRAEGLDIDLQEVVLDALGVPVDTSEVKGGFCRDGFDWEWIEWKDFSLDGCRAYIEKVRQLLATCPEEVVAAANPLTTDELLVRLLVLDGENSAVMSALSNAGVEIRDIEVDLVSLVLDFVGVPQDATFFDSETGGSIGFCRDWISNRWWDLKSPTAEECQGYLDWVRNELRELVQEVRDHMTAGELAELTTWAQQQRAVNGSKPRVTDWPGFEAALHRYSCESQEESVRAMRETQPESTED